MANEQKGFFHVLASMVGGGWLTGERQDMPFHSTPEGGMMMDQAGAKSMTLAQTVSPYEAGRPKWKEWDSATAVRDGLKASTWVYACVDLIARSAGMAYWNVLKKGPGGKWVTLQDHPLEALLMEPNPFMARDRFFYVVAAQLLLGGNAVATKVRARGIPMELWPLDIAAVSPVPDRRTFVSAYTYDQNGVSQDLDPQDVIHLQIPDPSDPFWGMSPMMAAARTIDTDVEAVRWNKVALQNRAVADGAWVMEKDLTAKQYKELREALKRDHKGTDNARNPYVLGGNAKWVPMALSPVEMDFIESRKFTREEICSVFRVPPPLIGLYENATLANIKTARQIFWMDTMVPFLESLAAVMTQGLAREFGDDIRLDYDVSHVDVFVDMFQDRVKTAKELWAMGVPFNVVNERLELGFRPIPGGDTGYIPGTLNPALAAGGQGGPNDGAPASGAGRTEPPVRTPRAPADPGAEDDGATGDRAVQGGDNEGQKGSREY